MHKALRQQIERILDSVNDMTIATIRPDGWPQATTVSFVHDGLTLYFATGAHAQKAENIAKTPKVSLTVDRPYESWGEIESLSMGGTARAVTDADEIARIEQLMIAKFPQVRDFAIPGSALAFIEVEPRAISVLDYRQGFGHTETVGV